MSGIFCYQGFSPSALCRIFHSVQSLLSAENCFSARLVFQQFTPGCVAVNIMEYHLILLSADWRMRKFSCLICVYCFPCLIYVLKTLLWFYTFLLYFLLYFFIFLYRFHPDIINLCLMLNSWGKFKPRFLGGLYILAMISHVSNLCFFGIGKMLVDCLIWNHNGDIFCIVNVNIILVIDLYVASIHTLACTKESAVNFRHNVERPCWFLEWVMQLRYLAGFWGVAGWKIECFLWHLIGGDEWIWLLSCGGYVPSVAYGRGDSDIEDTPFFATLMHFFLLACFQYLWALCSRGSVRN